MDETARLKKANTFFITLLSSSFNISWGFMVSPEKMIQEAQLAQTKGKVQHFEDMLFWFVAER